VAEVFLPIVLRNRYRVIERLGAGGAGTVYKVADLFAGPSMDEGRPLALKAVFGAFTDGEAVPELLRHEFRSLSVLRHPLIARVYDFGRIPERSALQGSRGRPGYFFTRDLIEGQDLKAYCKDLDVPQICRVCQQTAEVLDVLHRSGVVHGDFKPANVIVAPDGRPHLIDFGLVRAEGHSFGSSGTTPYLAPEILHGQEEDRRADLYSLGISIYRLLTKHLPMRDASVGEIARWHRRRGPLLVSKVRQVPGELDRLVQRLTDPNPDRRFPSAAEAALALAEVAVGMGEPSSPPARRFVPPAPGRNLMAPLRSLEATARRRLLDREGGPVLLAVEGEVGAGKSTLLKELAWRLQLRGAEVLGPYLQGLRLHAWTDVSIQGVAAIVYPVWEKPTPAGGAERADPSVDTSHLHRVAVAMALILCPRCRHLLGQDDPEQQPCTHCGGVFVSREAIAPLLAELRERRGGEPLSISPYRSPARQDRNLPPPAPREGELRYLACPLCSKPMNRFPLIEGYDLVVDICVTHGIWFDAEELHAATAYIRGRGEPLPDEGEPEPAEQVSLVIDFFFKG
jgi:Zn-finger nucleic acid-binding protein